MRKLPRGRGTLPRLRLQLLRGLLLLLPPLQLMATGTTTVLATLEAHLPRRDRARMTVQQRQRAIVSWALSAALAMRQK